MEKKKRNPWMLFIPIAVIFIVYGLVILWMGIYYGENVASLKVSNNGNSTCDYSFINSDNIHAFCHAQGFDGGWNGCSQDNGFTCYSTVGEYSRNKCFTYQELRANV